MQPAEPFDVRLVASRCLSPGVRELVFERADGKPMHFEPGQWVNLVLPLPDGELRRAYSIASPPNGTPRFELAVTRVTGGPGSEYLHDLGEGAVLRAIGPHGLFTRAPSDATPALFVATGTGVTPFRSMMLAASHARAGATLWLLFGARREEDILYAADFETWAARHPGARYIVTLSQPSEAWTGKRGYVQHHLHEAWAALSNAVAPAEPHLYICGLQRMIHAVRDLGRNELGIGRKHVHVERYD